MTTWQVNATLGPTMIDWITCRIPVRLPAPIAGGWTVKLNSDGTERSRTPHRLPVEGSFSSGLTIRAPSTSELEVSGNVTKWLQGHNLYGSDDARGLLWAALQRLEPHLGAPLSDVGLCGPGCLEDAILTRIDCTAMMQLDTPGDVLAWIRAAHATSSASHRGRPDLKRESTLIYGSAEGKNFTRWQILIYSKGREITAHPLPDFMMCDEQVVEWVNRCLRVEVKLGRLELEKKGLRALGAWNTATPSEMWSEKVGTITFNDAVQTDTEDLERLPSHLRGTYAQWKLGADLRKLLTTAKFYRHRSLILGLTGVDVAVPPAPSSLASVVPIKRALEARPVSRPPFADRIDARLRESGAFVFHTAA